MAADRSDRRDLLVADALALRRPHLAPLSMFGLKREVYNPSFNCSIRLEMCGRIVIESFTLEPVSLRGMKP
jgi:hypothetical protein